MATTFERVKEFIRNNPKCSYAQIAEGSNIPMSMVSGCLRVLIRQGEIIKHSNHNGQGKTLSNSYEVI